MKASLNIVLWPPFISFGEIKREILLKRNPKSMTSIRNMSLNPKCCSISSLLMMLLKYYFYPLTSSSTAGFFIRTDLFKTTTATANDVLSAILDFWVIDAWIFECEYAKEKFWFIWDLNFYPTSENNVQWNVGLVCIKL